MQVNIPAPWVASGIELEEAFRFGFPLTLGSLGSRFGGEDPPREKKNASDAWCETCKTLGERKSLRKYIATRKKDVELLDI